MLPGSTNGQWSLFRVNDRDSMINDLGSNEDPGFRTKKFCFNCYFGIIGQLDSSNPPLMSYSYSYCILYTVLTTLLTKTTEHTEPKVVCDHHQKLEWPHCRCQVQHFYGDVCSRDDDQHCFVCGHVHDQFQESWACAGSKTIWDSTVKLITLEIWDRIGTKYGRSWQ